ncbi:hypothetical protein [Hymenobacter psychrophilus]|uniref:YcxB-like protein n=1 Tax=Hymenobacter psychrophilus TaxID=651662 RepID=A0A1H3GV03_9BACT|nr:hypothetical protein [Hymenobacter psychrophilus]SDY06815.1 hypothetical protein SAMN04488069_105175 [Hymenobacter psychrophilus]
MIDPPYHLPAVRLSADDYVAVNFRLWRARPATRRLHWLLGTAIGLLTIGVGLDVWQNGQLQRTSSFIFLGVAVLYGVSRFGLVRYQLRRGYARNATLQQPIDFILTTTEVIGQSQQGKFSGPWTTMQRAVWVGPDWLLLYPTEAACYYLDMRRLQAPATRVDVTRLLARHQIRQQQT